MSNSLPDLPRGGGSKGNEARNLARMIRNEISKCDKADPILECSPPFLEMLDVEPDIVLERAGQRIDAEKRHSSTGAPLCWLRLYEDASLSKVVKILENVEIEEDKEDDGRQEDWIGEVVKVLDMGVAVSFATRRSKTFEKAFEALEKMTEVDAQVLSNRFVITPPEQLRTKCPIDYDPATPSFQNFQQHLHESGTPFITTGIANHWPAFHLWQNPAYFLRKTFGGRRLVPVEFGESYTAKDYRSEIIPFREFLQNYILPEKPAEIGYLAQHDLFTQIPALRDDIRIPDYCYTTPLVPTPYSAAALTSGLDTATQLEEPLLNIWLGPKGSKTPLHTDPSHNILAQVVGYKYVRLYAPENRPYLYPGDSDGLGNGGSNTSLVDVGIMTPLAQNGTGCLSHGPKFDERGVEIDLDSEKKKIETMKEFPLFGSAEYAEAILGPGECLYVPLGWWHYVQSLSISVSVSFWWN